jgi:hypothetical protein
MGGKQTAVDYLFEMWLQDNTITQSALEQAKQMERQQIIEAHNHGYWEGDDCDGNDEEYYNETYNPDPE